MASTITSPPAPAKSRSGALFVYGALIDARRRTRILGRNVEAEPARIIGYRRERSRYFHLVPETRAETPGMLLRGLDESDFSKLDQYEEVPRLYRRQRTEVIAAGGKRARCWVYMATARSRPTPGDRKPNAGASNDPNDPAIAPMPILEYDRARIAIIEPSRVIRPIEIAEHCVMCFFPEVIAQLVREGARARIVHSAVSEAGDYPVYEMDYGNRRIAMVHPGVGAPNAAARLERMIALGCRKFVACGGAGVLDGKIEVGRIVVPTAAVRDEGTSYHYLAPAREVAPTRRALGAIEAVLRENNHDYLRGKTWTTDAVYRETRPRMARRQREGCIVVDMEAAAFFAVARFRRIEMAQILYAGDSLAGRRWDSRGWNRHAMRERLFHLAASACLRI